MAKSNSSQYEKIKMLQDLANKYELNVNAFNLDSDALKQLEQLIIKHEKGCA